MGGGKLIGSDIDKDYVHSLCFITVLQTFCEGANNGGPSLAKSRAQTLEPSQDRCLWFTVYYTCIKDKIF